MKRKEYIAPVCGVHELETSVTLLAGSGVNGSGDFDDIGYGGVDDGLNEPD
ncbi:MAG: hypothetical protein IJ588_12800 [Prevotella sp.]|nr:hypothetical protein [Prevotella sp.]